VVSNQWIKGPTSRLRLDSQLLEEIQYFALGIASVELISGLHNLSFSPNPIIIFVQDTRKL
jgi:hypothetical protein